MQTEKGAHCTNTKERKIYKQRKETFVQLGTLCGTGGKLPSDPGFTLGSRGPERGAGIEEETANIGTGDKGLAFVVGAADTVPLSESLG